MSYKRSLYIPYVSNRIGLEYIVLSMEHTFQLGIVDRIESIPRTDGLSYQCFVYFSTWNETDARCVLIDTEFAKGNKIRLFHDHGQAWTICRNTSEIQTMVHEPPKHMSLCLYVPSDTHVQTIWNVIQGLDLGMVYRIDDVGLYNISREEESKHIWPHINRDVWSKFVHPCLRCYKIHFQYWYRTKSARAFQELLSSPGACAEIPLLCESAPWRFYEEEPITTGKNPWVYTRPPITL